MTYLEIINEVLKRLREDTVSTNTESSYSKLIGTFVKQAAEEVSNAYPWPNLISASSIGVSSTNYFMEVGSSVSDGNIDIISIYNSTTDTYLTPASAKWVRAKYFENIDNNEPRWYGDGGFINNGNKKIYFHPTSDTSYTFIVTLVSKYSQDETYSDSTEIQLPTLAVILRATALAISERGEDGGALSSEIDMQYTSALADAISIAENNNSYDNLSWNVV